MGVKAVELKVKLTGDPSELEKVISGIEKRVQNASGEFSIDSSDLQALLSGLNEAQSAGQTLKRDVDELNGALRGIGSSGMDQMATAFKESRQSLGDLVDTQRQALAGLKLVGKDGTAEYAALRDELAKNTGELRAMDKALDEVSESAKKSGSFIENAFKAEAIGNVGSELTDFAAKGLDIQKSIKTAAARNPDASAAELEELGSIGGAAYAAGFGDSVGEAILAAGDVRKNLSGILPNDELEESTLKAAALAQAWDEDINDVVAKSGPLFKNFNLDTAESFDLIAFAKSNLANPDDDALDTIKEYSNQFAEAGFSAEQTLGILERGLDAGAFNTDKVADATKEAILRITSVGDEATAALDEVKGAPAELVASLKKAVADARSGNTSIADALGISAGQIKDAVDTGQISDTVRKQLEIAIGNTPLEDIGAGAFTEIFSAPIPVDDIRARATQAGLAVEEAMAPANLWESITRGAESAFSSVAAAAGPIVAPLGGALSAVGQFAPALSLLQDQFGVFDVAGDLIKGKLVPSILSMIPGLGAQTVATGAATTAQAGLNAMMLLNPAFLVVAGIAAVVAAFLIFGKSTEDVINDVKEATSEAKDALDDAQKTVADTSGVDKQQKSVAALADEYDRLQGSTDPKDQARLRDVAQELATVMPQAADAVDEFNAAGEKIGTTYKINTDVVRSYTDAQLAQNAALRDAAISETQQKMRELAESTGDARDELTDLKEKQKAYQDAVAKGEKFVDTGFFGGWEDTRDALDEVTIQIGELEKVQGSANNQYKEGVKFLSAQGKTVEEIAAATDLSVDEVKKYKKELEVSEKAAKGAASATGDIKDKAAGAAKATDGLAKSAQRAKVNAQALADMYDKVRSAADSGADNAFKGVLQLRQQQREAERDIKIKQTELANVTDDPLFLKRRALEAEINVLRDKQKLLRQMETEEIAAAKSAFAEVKRLEHEELKLQVQLGLVEVNVDDYTEQAKDIRRATADILFGVAQASVEDELKKVMAEIDNELDKGIADIDKQIKELDAKKNDASLTNKVVGIDDAQRALRDQKDALRIKAQRDKEAAEAEIRAKQLEELKKMLADEQGLLDVAVDRRIATLEREIGALADSTSDDDLQEKLEKRLQILDLQRDKELASIVNGNEAYLDKYAEYKLLLRQAVEAATDEEKAALNQKAEQVSSEMGVLREQILNDDIKAITIREDYAARAMDEEAAVTREHYQNELEKLEKQQAKEEAILQKRLARQQEYFEAMAAFAESIADDSISVSTESKLQELERQRDEELISLEKFEEEKTRIQEEADRARQLSEARMQGLRLAADADELEQQKKHLQERIDLAEENKQFKQAEILREQLADINEALEEKGDTLQTSLDILKKGTQESIRGLFAHDEDAVKDPLKKTLATMAGYLQNLVSAKIVEVVIGSIPAGAGFLGAIAGFALKPVIEAAFSSLLGGLLNDLSSFSTGGRIDSPTLALVGDAARLGGNNREWIFTDGQLRQIMSEMLASSNAVILAGFDRLERAINGLSGRLYVRARDVYEGSQRYASSVRRRVVFGL